jgi:hypothetical protein
MPENTWEIAQSVRNRIERSFGSYSAFDCRTQYEYGIYNNLQFSLYLNSLFLDAKDAPDEHPPAGTNKFTRQSNVVQGVSFEFLYRLLSPIKSPVGLALLYQLQFDFYDSQDALQYRDARVHEFRLILQKNFLDDSIVTVFNIVGAVKSSRYQGQEGWSNNLGWNNELGINYRFASNWFTGFEIRNQNDFTDYHKHKRSLYWAGPNVHYGARRFWATLGALTQVYGTPNGTDEKGTFIGNNQYLKSSEKWEIFFKAGFPFQ